MNLQEITMDGSLKFQLLWDLGKLWKRLNRYLSWVSIESSHDFRASLCRTNLTNLSLKCSKWSLKVVAMEVLGLREKEEKMKRERRKRKWREEREMASQKMGPTILSSLFDFWMTDWPTWHKVGVCVVFSSVILPYLNACI